MLIDDCVDYEFHAVTAYDSLEEYNKVCKTDFTEDMIDENGDITFGGYKNQYGIFQTFDESYFKGGNSNEQTQNH